MSMILKEAFRYQNFLDSLLGAAECYLREENNFMIISDEHLRSKAVASAEDEVKDNLADRQLSVKPDVVIDFMMRVYSEKEMLSKAINSAKRQHCEEMDMKMSLNKTRQGIVESLKRMAKYKGRETILRGSAYALNSEGNQMEYRYDIKRTSKIDFDRFAVKKIILKLSAESDKVSTTIDYWLSSVPVDYAPVFDLNDTFEELVENYGSMSAAS